MWLWKECILFKKYIKFFSVFEIFTLIINKIIGERKNIVVKLLSICYSYKVNQKSHKRKNSS